MRAEHKSGTRHQFHVPSTFCYTSVVTLQALPFLTMKKLHCAKKALQNKADNIFWDGALYFPRVVSLQQLLQETKPNPPICKLERKSTTQTGIWFRTEWFAQCLRSILDKSVLSAKHLRGKRKFLLCCLNAAINQDDKIAWPGCPQ